MEAPIMSDSPIRAKLKDDIEVLLRDYLRDNLGNWHTKPTPERIEEYLRFHMPGYTREAFAKLFDIYGQEIAREAEQRGWSKGWSQRSAEEDYTQLLGKLRALKPQDGAFFLLSEIADVAKECQAELTSPDTTAAGNDLPSYDPKADIEATLRRKGQLTQKPPQPKENT